nr:hypothetical protein [uncultured Duncaniella sp.]
MKNVAFMPSLSRRSSTQGVSSGTGPSSNVRNTTLRPRRFTLHHASVKSRR